MTIHRYVLKGDPLQLVRRDTENFYDAQRAARQSAQVSFTQQHDEAPLFKGPLALEILFYMPIPQRGPKTTIPTGSPHIQRPYLLPLITFIDNTCRGVLWTETGQICSLNIIKQYDLLPRTELFITEIKYEK